MRGEVHDPRLGPLGHPLAGTSALDLGETGSQGLSFLCVHENQSQHLES